MSKTREQINDWLKTIDVTGKTVLDVGAGRPRAWLIPPIGEGNSKVKGEPRDYLTIDINPEFCCDLDFDMNEPLPDFKSFGFSRLDDTPTIDFDYIFCLETLEHLWNPLQVIESLAKITKEKLFLSAPLVNPIHDTHDYLRFTLQWFEEVLPKHGFKDIKIIPRVTSFEDILHSFYVSEGMRMSKISRKLGYSKNYFDIGYCVEARK